MFNDSETESSGFVSSWKVSKTCTENETQTKDVKGEEKQEQTSFKASKEVQTDELEKSKTLSNFDEKALAAFLIEICPKVEKELTKMERSQAFALYHLSTDKDQQENVTELFMLPRPKEPSDGPVKVSAMSWSCTGNVLAVACSSVEHSDWCNHSGCIQLYNIERATFIETALSKPRVIETTSCVVVVSMHPYEPSIIAAGTMSGEIIIWKLQDDDVNYIIGSSELKSHTEPVSQISWIKDDLLFQSVLVSTALDGQLMLWEGRPHSSTFKLKQRYVMGENEPSCEPGISCFSFCPNKNMACVVATEGGNLYFCRLDKALPTFRGATPKVGDFQNPVVGKVEETFSGTVTCIEFSPYHDDTFATTGAHLPIRIYVLKKSKPQLIIWCDMDLVGLQWSITQANILITWGSEGHVNVFDALSGDCIRKLCPAENQENKSNQLLNAVQFNKKRPQLLALGDVEGHTHIWKIPSRFSVVSRTLDCTIDK